MAYISIQKPHSGKSAASKAGHKSFIAGHKGTKIQPRPLSGWITFPGATPQDAPKCHEQRQHQQKQPTQQSRRHTAAPQKPVKPRQHTHHHHTNKTSKPEPMDIDKVLDPKSSRMILPSSLSPRDAPSTRTKPEFPFITAYRAFQRQKASARGTLVGVGDGDGDVAMRDAPDLGAMDVEMRDV